MICNQNTVNACNLIALSALLSIPKVLITLTKESEKPITKGMTPEEGFLAGCDSPTRFKTRQWFQ
jgi:hypothetical protein